MSACMLKRLESARREGRVAIIRTRSGRVGWFVGAVGVSAFRLTTEQGQTVTAPALGAHVVGWTKV